MQAFWPQNAQEVLPLFQLSSSQTCVPCSACSAADFIFAEYATEEGGEFRDMVWRIAEDFACADVLLRLPGHAPMPAFRAVEDVPLVVRRPRRSRDEV